MIEKVEERNKNRILVTHGSGVYDVTTFAKIHPGGAGYLTRFANKDITKVMDGAKHQHGSYAYRWMAQVFSGQNYFFGQTLYSKGLIIFGLNCENFRKEYLEKIFSEFDEN